MALQRVAGEGVAGARGPEVVTGRGREVGEEETALRVGHHTREREDDRAAGRQAQ
jgi:hypothetical protein